MAADAILNYAKASKVPVRDSLDLDSRHIKLPFHKFSAIYIFFPFDNLKRSNDLGLSRFSPCDYNPDAAITVAIDYELQWSRHEYHIGLYKSDIMP